MLRSLLLSTLLAASCLLGCAPDSGLDDRDEAAEDSEAALSLPLTVLDVRKSPAPNGLTVITKKAEFVEFFGSQPPAGLNFNKSWVLHYSMGIANTGGYAAGISQVERIGSGQGARLAVHTTDTSPGPNCIVTMALTNPQVAVVIPKQKKSIQVEQTNEALVTDCGTVQNWCAAALCGPGQVCDEFQDACVEEPFCPKVKCANGYVCDEDVDACVGRPCDPDDSNSCPAGFSCDNQIACITTPCPTDYRCEPAPAVSCDEIGWVGICQGPELKYCNGDELVVQNCAPGQCDFVEAYEYYDCVP